MHSLIHRNKVKGVFWSPTWTGWMTQTWPQIFWRSPWLERAHLGQANPTLGGARKEKCYSFNILRNFPLGWRQSWFGIQPYLRERCRVLYSPKGCCTPILVILTRKNIFCISNLSGQMATGLKGGHIWTVSSRVRPQESTWWTKDFNRAIPCRKYIYEVVITAVSHMGGVKASSCSSKVSLHFQCNNSGLIPPHFFF